MDKAIVDESLDSDYKLIKDEQGKVTAEYVGTPPKNGFYKRQIWVQKALTEKLPANHTMQGKSSVPPKHFYSLEERNDSLVPEANFHRRSIIVLVDMLIVTAMTILRLHMHILILTPLRGILSMVCLMVPLVAITMFVLKQLLHQVLHCLLSHLLVCGWLRRTNSSAGLCLRWIRMGHGQWLH